MASFGAGGVSVSKTTFHDGEDINKNVVTDYSYVLANNSPSWWGYEAPYYTTANKVVNSYKKSGARRRVSRICGKQ